MPSILFVCTANQYRSPIAAARFKQMLLEEGRPGTWYIASAGTWTTPDLPATPWANKLARGCGLDLDGHRTRTVSAALLAAFDLILVMESGHKEALVAEFPWIAHHIFLLSEVVDGSQYNIPDPAAAHERAEGFVRELCRLVERGYLRIAETASVLSESWPGIDQIVENPNSATDRRVGAGPVPIIPPELAPPDIEPAAIVDSQEGQSPQESPSRPTSTGSPGRAKPAKHMKGWLLLLIPVLLLIGWMGVRTWQILRLVKDVQSEVAQLRILTRALPEKAQLEQAGSTLPALNQDLKALEAQVGPFLWIGPSLRWVPIYGGDLASARDLLDLADELTLLGNQTYQALQPLMEAAPQPEGSSTISSSEWVDLWDRAQPGLAAARATLERARQTREHIYLQQLSPSLQRLLSEEVDPALALADDSLTLAASFPSMFGMSGAGSRTYLLLVENDDELRPSGGFITAVGMLVVKDGKVVSMTFKDSGEMEDWSKPYPLAPWQLEQYMNSPVLVLRDSNWFVDFPTTAEFAKYLYRLGQPEPVTIDGVIAFNQHVLIALLEVVGPIQMDGVPYPVSAANVEEYMRNAKAPPTPDKLSADWDRKAFIPKIAQALLDRLLSGNVDWNRLSNVILHLLDKREILLQTDDPGAARVFAGRGWDGAVQPGNADFLYVVDSNIGFNKTNAVITQQLVYDVDLSDPARPTGELSVSQSNHAAPNVPCIQWDDGQITSQLWYPIDRCYWDYLRVYQSSRAALVDSTPHAVPDDWMILGHGAPPRVDVLEDGIAGVQGYGTLVVIPAGQALTTSFKFALSPGALAAGPESGQSIYRLKIQKQAGTQAIPVTVRIHFPRHTDIVSAPAGSLIQDNNLMLEANLDTDLAIEVVVDFP